jgi:AraC-like DNA-binding protein
MRHTVVKEHDPGRGVSIATLAREYPRKHYIPEHAHSSDQLVYASCGVMEVASGQSLWIIPPHFGLWIPAGVPHRIRMPERVSMRTLYLRTGLLRRWSDCRVLYVGPFLRELIFEIVRVGSLRTRNGLERALREVLLAKLRQASPAPTGVTLPEDERASAVARVVIESPALSKPLAELCAEAGVGVRTLQRTFQREVGMNFESWRRQVRLMKAVELLVARRSVKEAAFRVGYRNSGALVALFRQTFGKSPRAWALAAGVAAGSQPPA